MKGAAYVRRGLPPVKNRGLKPKGADPIVRSGPEPPMETPR